MHTRIHIYTHMRKCMHACIHADTNVFIYPQENLPVGTMVFMAPETFTNPSPQLTGQTDVWALGVILTWIMTAVEILGS